MTPEQQRAIAIAKARKRKAEAESGNSGREQPTPQGQLDQLAMFDSLDRSMEGNPGRVGAFANQFTNATTFGQFDRLMGGMDQLLPGIPGSGDGSFGDSVDSVRSFRQDLREKHPVSAPAGDIAGAVAGGLGLDDAVRKGTEEVIKRLPQGASALEKTARYGTRLAGLAGEGLAQYALWQAGAGASNEEAAQGRDIGIEERGQMVREGLSDPLTLALAAGAGPAASGIFRAGRGMATGRATPRHVPGGGSEAPSVDDIKALKDEAYKVADEIGVKYSADGYQDMVAGIENKLANLNLDPVLHPRTFRTLKNIQDRVGKDMTLQELDNIRKFTRRDVINSGQAGSNPGANDAEKMLGSVIIDEIDSFIQKGTNTVAGNGPEGANAILRARSLNSTYRKAQALEDANESATLRAASTGSGGNYENALRQELRKIYSNPKRLAGFDEAERAAMRKVIEGGPVQNALRLYGKLSPQGNGLMAALGVGTTAANPVLAPVWLGAMGSKALAQRGIKNNFDQLSELVRGGANKPPMRNITPPAPGGPVAQTSGNVPPISPPIPTATAAPAMVPQVTPKAPGGPNPYIGRKSFRTEAAKKPVENSFVPAGMLGESVAGGAVGGAIPVDYNGDGQINMADRAIGAAIGASASPTVRGMRRVKDRIVGSGGLPQGTVRAVNGNTDIYDVHTKAGPIEFGVQLPEYRGMAALPRQIRKAADANRQYLGSTAPVAKAQAVGEVPDMILDQADAKRAYGSGDAAEVSWSWADGRPSENLNARKIHDAFEQSFRAFEDHAIRHRQPVYSFSGLSDAHTRLYKRRLSQPGALPRGYEAFEVGGNFYVVKNGDRRLLKKAIENYDDPESAKKISKAAIAQ